MAVEKKSCSISEASRISGIPRHVLRYWETEFPLLKPRKNLSGRREYSKIDIDLIMKIKHLLYEEEHTISGARKKLAGKSSPEGGAVRHLLDEVTKELREIIEML